MRRLLALLLTVTLALAACTGGDATGTTPEDPAAPGTVDPQADAAEPDVPEPDAPDADVPAPAVPPPADDPVALRPAEEALQLEPGLTDATTIPGEPLLVVIGDSIGAGTGLLEVREGFVWRTHRALAERREDGIYGLENLSEPGATSASALEGQVDAAEEALTTRAVDTVVVSLGGNDLLGLFTGACGGGVGSAACASAIDTAIDGYEANLDTALTRLDAMGAEARLVVLQVYNPFDLGLGLALERVSTEATIALNAAAARAAERHGALLADGYTTLAGTITTTTNMGDQQPDIHPNPLGHDLLALAILEALDAATS